jgi:hypothetical protein
MLESVGFVAEQLDERTNPRNDYTHWASFLAAKPS